jgi:hypothetical protein
MRYWCKDLNKDKTVVKVRGSTNDISNKYNINFFLLLNWKPEIKEVSIGWFIINGSL